MSAATATASVTTDFDPEFLAALQQCRSAAVRMLVIRLDSLAVLLRAGAFNALELADELNCVGMSLLALASERREGEACSLTTDNQHSAESSSCAEAKRMRARPA